MTVDCLCHGGLQYERHTRLSDVLLTVHISILILVINQLDAHNLFYNTFIAYLYTCKWSSRAQVDTGRPPTGVMIPEAV